MDLSEKFHRALAEAAHITAHLEQAVAVAAIIADALRGIGQDPVLVGGAAVEFYTQGGYSTADIDMVAFGGPKLLMVMDALGFKRRGKDFIHEELGLYVEFPSEALGPSEKADIIEVGKRSLRIISREDLIIDRLCSYKYWKSVVDGVNALLLLELNMVDSKRLLDRAKEEDVEDALQAVKEVRELVIRQRLPKKQASALLEKAMRGKHST